VFIYKKGHVDALLPLSHGVRAADPLQATWVEGNHWVYLHKDQSAGQAELHQPESAINDKYVLCSTSDSDKCYKK